ncbi:hypothetical protein ABZ616_09650 [Streptomyces noursei]|uniref:hypothetical protein n=1 Tax=Streptomyces noursei TaxID=1971 RepID=UPI0033F7CF91
MSVIARTTAVSHLLITGYGALIVAEVPSEASLEELCVFGTYCVCGLASAGCRDAGLVVEIKTCRSES